MLVFLIYMQAQLVIIFFVSPNVPVLLLLLLLQMKRLK